MKQNKNFNFQSMSSTNEKMLIIFSWIIVVIIVVLVGLYYGQQVREQEVSVARVQNANATSDVEISSDSDSKVEEGELSAAKTTESVLTDNMALNKNEVFCIQIGSHEGPDFYGESKADEIIAEFSPKGLYSKKVMINPEKSQYIVQLGIFKNYEDAKTFLNSVKIKNYPAEISIVPDPNSKIDYAPPLAEAKTSEKKEIVVSTPDSKIIDGIKTGGVKPQDKQPEKPVQAKTDAEKAAGAAKIPDAAKVSEPVKTETAEVKPAGEAVTETKAAAAAPILPVEKTPETENNTVLSQPAAKDEPASIKEELPVPEAVEAKPDFKVVSAREEVLPAAELKPAAEKVEIKPKDEKKENKIKEEKKKSSPGKKKEAKPAAKESPVAADDEITAGEDEFEIVADDSSDSAESGDKKGPYYIQIGTYKSSKNADIIKTKLKKIGVGNVSIVPGKVASGDPVYRVRITGYSSKDTAGKAFDSVKSSFPDVKPYISK